jgi:hypothetical protein
VVVINQAWAYIVIGVWVVIWLGSLAQLTFRIGEHADQIMIGARVANGGVDLPFDHA